MYAYETHDTEGVINDRNRTIFNTPDGKRGGKNFVQVHINLNSNKILSFKVNNGNNISPPRN